MKSLPIFLLIISLPLLFMGQNPVTKPGTKITYGPDGGRQETTTSTDEFGRTVTTDKYYDAQNRLREEFTSVRKYDNSGTEEITIQYRENGTKRTWTKWDKYDDGTSKCEHKVYDEKGNVIEGSISIGRTGSPTTVYYWDTVTKKFKGYDEIAVITPGNNSGKEQQVCVIPNYQVYAAYSALFGSSYPFGLHVNVKRNFTDRIGVGIDVSTHRKKDGDVTISRSFLLIDGQYVTGDVKECDRDFIANIEVLIGIGRDHIKYKGGGYSSSSGETGPAFGAGVGGVIRITNSVSAKAQGNVLLARWGDQWFDNYRISAGVQLSLGELNF